MAEITVTPAANSGSQTVMVPASGDTTGATDPGRLQAAINSLRGVGGTVGLTNKTYFCASGITLYPGIGLVGLGGLGVLTQPLVSTPTKLTALLALKTPLITCVVDPLNPTWQSFPYMRGFVVNGYPDASTTAQDGVVISDVNGAILDTIFDDVQIFQMGGHGINHSASASKTWFRSGYLESNIGSGWYFGAGGGEGRLIDSYIYGNHGYGVDATSADKFQAIGCDFYANVLGAAQIWTTTTWKLQGNHFLNNGGPTAPTITMKFTSVEAGICEGNTFRDFGRGAGAAKNFITARSMWGLIANNTFLGQQSGFPAISVTADAANDLRIRNNQGFNPYGQITNPLDVTRNKCGIAGTVTLPVASTDYTISEVDQFVSISGGSGLSITIKDPAGNTIQSGLATLAGQFLPIGFKFNCGAFTGSPTVSAWAN